MKWISYIYIFLFFILQNNFILTNKLAVNEGLGLGKYRAGILLIMIIIGVIITFLRIMINRKLWQISFRKIDILTISLLLLLIISHCIVDYFFNGTVDFIGVAPLIEGIFFAVFFYINVREGIYISSRNIYILSFIVFGNIIFELLYYYKDFMQGVSYGPFRANIAGLVINRNPSFFYPIFALVIIRFCPIKPILKTIFLFIFIIYLLTLFYRTIYVALIFPLVLDFLRFGVKISLKMFLRYSVFLVLIVAGLFILDTFIESNFSFSIIKAFNGRFSSTFTDYSEDDAQSDRVGQIPDMIFEIIRNPLGMGFSGLVENAEIYNYAFYFLQPILYLGWLVLFLYYVLYKRFLSIYKNSRNNFQNRILLFCLLYFFMILIFFPYMNYFTFLSIIACLLRLYKVEILLKK